MKKLLYLVVILTTVGNMQSNFRFKTVKPFNKYFFAGMVSSLAYTTVYKSLNSDIACCPNKLSESVKN